MTQSPIRLLPALAVLGGAPLAALAQPVAGTCAIERMAQDSLAPSTLAFPFMVDGQQIPTSIDAAAGEIRFDFGALPILEFTNTFSQQSRVDTLDFQDEEAVGTIDAGGNVILPNVRGINCTQGKCPGGPPCPCIPGNLCSNDPTRVCVSGGTGDLACEDGGVCQGVCSNDRTRTCATSLDCDPPGFCGEGVGMRLEATFTTGATTFEGFTLVGSGTGAFTDGVLDFVSVHSTPPETFAIGDIGVSALKFRCALSPTPSGDAVPPAAWTVKNGTVKLGKGEPGAGDDKLTLSGSFIPDATLTDITVVDLFVVLGTGTTPVMTITIPAGSLIANGKGTKFKLVDKDGTVVGIKPTTDDGAVVAHKVAIKKGKTGVYGIAIASKNLNLDGLDVATIVTGVQIGAQTPTETGPVKAKKTKRTF